ncbi:hypothetical protein P12x_005643 [Tundrisphaera lichenicola]|uniref:hypothetical protein n=1 Tax=Tundrisphaera lichenicola TaxID=2029860 RepID=UPI003EBC2F1B
MWIKNAILGMLAVTVAVSVIQIVTKDLVNKRLFAQPVVIGQNAGPAQPGSNLIATGTGVGAPGIELVRLTPAEAAKARMKQPIVPGLKSSSSLIESSIGSVGGHIQFHAKVELIDSNVDMKYMWSIRVVGVDNPDFSFVKHYENRTFMLPEFRQVMIDFDESIAADPGTYKVVLSLYKLKPGIDFSKVDDNEYANPYLATRFGDVISVE